MESPVRKMQKRNDYNRHKLLRKIKRRRKAAAEQQSHAAEKELRRKIKMPKFDDGLDGWSTVKEYADAINNNEAFQYIKALDPTGISSWYDVGEAAYQAYKNPNGGTISNAALEAFGAIPLFGKVGKAIKLAGALQSAKRIKIINPRMGKYIEQNVYKTAEQQIDPVHIDAAKVGIAGYLGNRTIGLIKDLYDSAQYEKSKKKKQQGSTP